MLLQSLYAQHARKSSWTWECPGKAAFPHEETLLRRDPALVRLEQQGRIKGAWGKSESNREAKFYAITKNGEKALAKETLRWRRMSGLVDKLLSEGA